MPMEPEDRKRFEAKQQAGKLGRPSHEVAAERTAVALERIGDILERYLFGSPEPEQSAPKA